VTSINRSTNWPRAFSRHIFSIVGVPIAGRLARNASSDVVAVLDPCFPRRVAEDTNADRSITDATAKLPIHGVMHNLDA